jgi:hypothetical protein
MMLALAFAAAIAAPAPQADGSFFTGNDLHEVCQSTEGFHEVMCTVYIAGVNDAMVTVIASKAIKPLYCLPKHVDGEQLADIVRKYLKNNPASRHTAASSIVMIALRVSFPCK